MELTKAKLDFRFHCCVSVTGEGNEIARRKLQTLRLQEDSLAHSLSNSPSGAYFSATASATIWAEGTFWATVSFCISFDLCQSPCVLGIFPWSPCPHFSLSLCFLLPCFLVSDF